VLRAQHPIDQAQRTLRLDPPLFAGANVTCPVRHHRFVYHDREHDVTLTDLSMIHVLELPKLTCEPDGTVEWQWLRFLAARTPEEMTMAAGDNPHIARAATLVRHYNADEQLRHELQAHERFLHDQASRELTARLDGFDDGHAEGHAKGRAEGHAEGRAEGMADGEHRNAVRVACNALSMAMPVDQVAALTGLEPTEVARLSQEP